MFRTCQMSISSRNFKCAIVMITSQGNCPALSLHFCHMLYLAKVLKFPWINSHQRTSKGWKSADVIPNRILPTSPTSTLQFPHLSKILYSKLKSIAKIDKLKLETSVHLNTMTCIYNQHSFDFFMETGVHNNLKKKFLLFLSCFLVCIVCPNSQWRSWTMWVLQLH